MFSAVRSAESTWRVWPLMLAITVPFRTLSPSEARASNCMSASWSRKASKAKGSPASVIVSLVMICAEHFCSLGMSRFVVRSPWPMSSAKAMTLPAASKIAAAWVPPV